MAKWIVLLILIMSCTKNYSEYNITERGNAFITPKDSDIAEVDIVKWHIGSTFKQTVSKGIRLKIDFPILRKKDLIELARKKGIDAWLITVTKSTMTGDDLIGSRYVPLIVPGQQTRGNLRIKQMKHGFIDVYYAAAAISKRFERFECPAFNHNFVIEDYELKKKKKTLSKIFISPVERRTVSGNVEPFGYLPSVLNGGTELEGTYHVRIALFNTKTKMKESSYLELPSIINITKERHRPLKGCTDFKIPPKEKEKDAIKSFRWKK